MKRNDPLILADTSWARNGDGIARYTREILTRIPHVPLGGKFVSLHPLTFLTTPLQILGKRPDVYFTTGFNPPLYSIVPFVFGIADLIHLQVPDENSVSKRMFYETVLKPATRRAFRVLTVSEFSKRQIIEWSGAPEHKIVVNGNGVSPAFNPEGPRHEPGYPYLFYVGNCKPHKNVPRLIDAFAAALPDLAGFKLLLSGDEDPAIRRRADALGISSNVCFAGKIPESNLPDYYRGATALAFPSLLEGFGLPALEAMACGTPVVCSDRASLPEVVGDAALLIDAEDVGSIAQGLRNVVQDPILRSGMRHRGLEQARRYSWDRAAAIAHRVLIDAIEHTGKN